MEREIFNAFLSTNGSARVECVERGQVLFDESIILTSNSPFHSLTEKFEHMPLDGMRCIADNLSQKYLGPAGSHAGYCIQS